MSDVFLELMVLDATFERLERLGRIGNHISHLRGKNLHFASMILQEDKDKANYDYNQPIEFKLTDEHGRGCWQPGVFKDHSITVAGNLVVHDATGNPYYIAQKNVRPMSGRESKCPVEGEG